MNSKLINRFIEVLEEATFESIKTFLDKNLVLEFVEHSDIPMSFNPDYSMKGISKKQDKNGDDRYCLVTEDDAGKPALFDLDDFAVVPLHDLLICVEEIEAYELQKKAT